MEEYQKIANIYFDNDSLLTIIHLSGRKKAKDS